MVSFVPEESDAAAQRQALISAARAGNAQAQGKLATLYRVGDDLTAQDFSEALRWYRLAAAQGDANAANDLGSMILNGMGTPPDSAEAAKWYRKSAERGVAVAQFNLPCRYVKGDGVEQNDREAVHWLLQAARQGHVAATAQLGEFFCHGRGVERNVIMAARLHSLAAARGDVVSMASLLAYREEIERHALAGSLRAALVLAKMFDDGIGVDKNLATAYAWLLWAKRHGDRDDDQAARNELYEHTLTVYSELSGDAEDEAYGLVQQLAFRTEQT